MMWQLRAGRVRCYDGAVHTIEMSAAIGALIVQAAAAKGVDPIALREATGFDASSARDPDARISLELEAILWNTAARMADDAAFGLHAAELVKPGAFDVMDYAVRSAPTLRISLERLVRYNRLVHDAAVFSVIEQGATTRIEHAFRIGHGAQCRHSAEFTLAAVITIGRQASGGPLFPRAVEFRHGKPSDDVIAEHRRIFGVEPTFARRVNAVELDRTALDRPLPEADPTLFRIIERHAEALLASRPSANESTSDRARRVLSTMLGEGDASLARVAGKLRMSERSLQRKLADEGLTFDVLLDEMRHDLALRYLADPRIAVAEVAYLLGFSEPSPFHRAFKRWTGMTPSEARNCAA